ncbi:MAG: SgcJ/EcaC family oxidoreductase [Candidatus Obscuribacterales bacterium]|nr:SgcJ/EcaC family oxidoreductase [Candidatus Obscuribacterales bacterium]
MTKNWIAFIALTLGFALSNFPADGAPNSRKKSSAGTVVGKSSSTAAETKAGEDREHDVRAVLISLEQAFASKTLAKVIELFSENAIFIDQSGEQTQGREPLRNRFAPLFQQETIPVVGLHPESVRFPAPGVASVVGVVSRKRGTSQLPATRFTMLMVQTNSNWQISEITETVIQSAQFEDRLAELDWMIGEWRVNKTDVDAKMNVEWAAGKKFILAKTTITKPDKTEQIDTQVIGWDPQNNRIISWHFDSNGGYGSGAWSKRPDKNEWSVDVIGVGADGSTTRATNVFQLKGSSEFSWQSVNRSQNDEPVADTEALNVQRLKAQG